MENPFFVTPVITATAVSITDPTAWKDNRGRGEREAVKKRRGKSREQVLKRQAGGQRGEKSRKKWEGGKERCKYKGKDKRKKQLLMNNGSMDRRKNGMQGRGKEEWREGIKEVRS